MKKRYKIVLFIVATIFVIFAFSSYIFYIFYITDLKYQVNPDKFALNEIVLRLKNLNETEKGYFELPVRPLDTPNDNPVNWGTIDACADGYELTGSKIYECGLGFRPKSKVSFQVQAKVSEDLPRKKGVKMGSSAFVVLRTDLDGDGEYAYYCARLTASDGSFNVKEGVLELDPDNCKSHGTEVFKENTVVTVSPATIR